MRLIFTPALVLTLLLCAAAARAQDGAGAGAPARQKTAAEVAAEKAFHEGNALMGERKYPEALARYRQGLEHQPDDPSLLYNASTAAVIVGDFAGAAPYLKQLVGLYPDDWQSRAKLIQTFQALGDLRGRDVQRVALFDLRRRGGGDDDENPEMSLSRQEVYCRERFEVAGQKVMAFEHFELKGPRALRYAFVVLDDTGDKEAYRISLGSYDSTNAIWAELNEEKAKGGGRLFHLDGYFPGGRHATYGMYHPEPSYDETRAVVLKILAGERKPAASSGPAPAPAEPKKP